MTQEEERIYLTELLISATEWQVSEGETRSAIELEVIDRIRKLNGMPSIDVVGVPSNEVKLSSEVDVNPVIAEEDYKALEAAKLNEHLASPDKATKAVNEWKSKRVRCQENGHPVWHLRSECVKEPRDNRNGGPAWTWKWLGPQDKKAQENVDKLSDEFWKAHEHGNDL